MNHKYLCHKGKLGSALNANFGAITTISLIFALKAGIHYQQRMSTNNKHSWQEVENVLLLHLLPLFRLLFTLHAEMICHIDFKRAISFSISSTTSLFAITSFWLYTIKTLPPYFSVKSSKLAFMRSDNE